MAFLVSLLEAVVTEEEAEPEVCPPLRVLNLNDKLDILEVSLNVLFLLDFWDDCLLYELVTALMTPLPPPQPLGRRKVE